jgi:hypothetical protein
MMFQQLLGLPPIWIKNLPIKDVNKYVVVLCVVMNSVGKKEKKFAKHV